LFVKVSCQAFLFDVLFLFCFLPRNCRIAGNQVKAFGNCADNEKSTLYTMLPPSMIMSVGNFYSILRQRPVAKSNNSYEYMPNVTYAFKDVKRQVEQMGFKVLPSWMWSEGAFISTKDEQLHQYVEWCGCNTLDFPAMDRMLGLTQINFGGEIVYKESDLPIIPPAPNSSGCKGKRIDPIKTVQRLQELGVISD
jgi:hypothetical protein